jgi:LacI family transcriptional regulator
MDAVYDAGLRIPQDVAIVGVDDVAAASLRGLALTTVRQPAAEMARRAVKCCSSGFGMGGESHWR